MVNTEMISLIYKMWFLLYKTIQMILGGLYKNIS